MRMLILIAHSRDLHHVRRARLRLRQQRAPRLHRPERVMCLSSDSTAAFASSSSRPAATARRWGAPPIDRLQKSS